MPGRGSLRIGAICQPLHLARSVGAPPIQVITPCVAFGPEGDAQTIRSPDRPPLNRPSRIGSQTHQLVAAPVVHVKSGLYVVDIQREVTTVGRKSRVIPNGWRRAQRCNTATPVHPLKRCFDTHAWIRKVHSGTTIGPRNQRRTGAASTRAVSASAGIR